MSTTPNMLLVVPEVLVTTGPQYATQMNTALDVVDAHDHSSGKGVRISPSGLNINADLPFNSYQATGLKGVVLTDQNTTTYTTPAALFRSGADLYYRDSAGNLVRITASGALNLATVGAITALASPAAATYVLASKKFVWTSTGTEYATMESGDLKILSTTAGASNAVTIKVDVATSAYDFKLPVSGPADNQYMRMKSATAAGFVSLLGTTNQITITQNAADTTFALPQNIHTAATPTFAGMTLTGTLNGTAVTLSGNVGAVAGVFSGNVSGVNGTFTGDVSGVNASFSGDITLSGFLKSITGTFINATLRSLSTSNDISSSTKVTAPTLQAGTNTLTSVGGLSVNQVLTPTILPAVIGDGTEIAGRTNGSAYGAGIIGQIITASMASNIATSTGYQNLTSYTLPAGIWEVSANIIFEWTATQSTSAIQTIEAAISLSSGLADSSTYYQAVSVSSSWKSSSSGMALTLSPYKRIINVSSATTVYLVGRSDTYAGGTNGARFSSLGTLLVMKRVG